MYKHFLKQSGQTIIETVIGIFILIMGITASVGLAVYSLHSTSNVTKQLIGSGLAREGIEAVRNMRDTNWLQGAISGNCYDYTGGDDAFCYPENVWIDGFYDLDQHPTQDSHSLQIDSAAADSNQYWDLDVQTGNNAHRFWLYYDDDASTGSLYTTNSGSGNVDSGYRREIRIEEESAAPYNTNIGPRLKVTSRVWWSDKGCPATDTFPTSRKCSVELISYLTNWRNY